MQKKDIRKGFTTVELVIVIAVIAILATVLIPTFSNLIEKAHASAAIQETKGSLEAMLHEYDGELKGGTYYFVYDKTPEDTDGRVWYLYQGGKLHLQTVAPTLTNTNVTGTWSHHAESKILDGYTLTKQIPDLSINVEVVRVPNAQ